MPQTSFCSPYIVSIATCCLTQHVFCIFMADTMTAKKKEQPLLQFVLSLYQWHSTTTGSAEVSCPNYQCLLYVVTLMHLIMIRKKTVLEANSYNISSISLFESYMAGFRPELGTCRFVMQKRACIGSTVI